MSSAKSHTTLSRQWELLNLIPTRGDGKTAAELQAALRDQGFDVTKRTVERDLNDLSMVFPILSDEGKPAQLWRWLDNKDIQLPGSSVAEAVMLQLVEGTLQQILPQALLQGLESRFSQARKKLQALEQTNHNARLMDKIAVVAPGLPMLPPLISPTLYDAVQQALTSQLQLQARYTAVHNQQTKEYVLNPLGLVQRGHVTYLVATVAPYLDVRLFALHRFSELVLHDKTLVTPPGFELKVYLQSGALQFANGDPITLQARVSPQLTLLLQEAAISDDMQLIAAEDGWQHLSATVHHGWQLRWWILSHSSHIEVVNPPELRAEIVKQLRAATALYPELLQPAIHSDRHSDSALR